MANLHEIKNKPDPDVIEYLEQLLRDAKEGRFKGIMIVSETNNGTTVGGYAGEFDIGRLMWAIFCQANELWHRVDHHPSFTPDEKDGESS